MAIVLKLLAILESIEGNYSQFKRLEEYGQLVDRIMGAATSLSIAIPELKKVLDSMGNTLSSASLFPINALKSLITKIFIMLLLHYFLMLQKC